MSVKSPNISAREKCQTIPKLTADSEWLFEEESNNDKQANSRHR